MDTTQVTANHLILKIKLFSIVSIKINIYIIFSLYTIYIF